MLRVLDLDHRLVFHHDGFEFNTRDRKPHDFDRETRRKRIEAADKVIYMTRNPGDVLISLYHQVTGRFGDIFEYTGTISDFVRDDYFGAQPLRQFREMWKELGADPKCLVCKYEDFHRDTERSLKRLLDYLEVPVDTQRVRAAVSQGQFDKMQAVELRDTFPDPWLRPRNGALKVRSGRMEAYRLALDATDVRHLEDIFPELKTSVFSNEGGNDFGVDKPVGC
jgi:hypothetical protein